MLADHEELDVEGPALEVENAEENARSVARHELETALSVFELDAADLLNDEVGDEAEETAVPFALDFDSLAKLVAGAGHECEAIPLNLLEFSLNFWVVSQISSEVGVHHEMEVAIGNEHAETDGSSLATVDIVSDDLEVLVHKGASDIECFVFGGVVDDDDLVGVVTEVFQSFLQSVAEAFLLIISRDYNAQLHLLGVLENLVIVFNLLEQHLDLIGLAGCDFTLTFPIKIWREEPP